MALLSGDCTQSAIAAGEPKGAIMRTRKHLSKTESQRIHARERFRRRKNIDFTDELHHEAVSMIRSQDSSASFVQKQSRRLSIWEIAITGIHCRVVYDCKRKNIVTVLPERWNADYVQRWWEN